jgi:UDP-N-acetylglucosamine acyltransferase
MPVHKTSIVQRDTQIGKNVTIGPHCYIGQNVCIDNGTVLGANVVIEGWTKIGKNCRISSGAVMGGAPQIIGFKDIPSWVQIGNNTEIREFVSIHRSSKENESTYIGSGVYLMAYVHVAHDCQIGDNVIATNYVGISGHVLIGEKAVIGGHAGIHQFIRIGKLAMVGGMTRLTKDVPPYSLVEGNPPKLYGRNTVGLQRSEISPSVRGDLKKAFKFISRSNLNTSQALDKIKNEIPESEEIKYLLKFIETSKRGIHK